MLPVEVPPDLVNTTVDPPVVKLFPAASLAVSVNVIPAPDCTVLVETLTKEVAGLMAPALTVTVGEAVVTDTPPMVAKIEVAVPAVTPVKTAR